MAQQSWGIEIDDSAGVRTIVVENPPVNALSHDVRVALMSALEEAMALSSVHSIVLGAKGKTFFSGADIRELERPVNPRVFHLTQYMEALGKPVVAAIGGLALGGGLEVALACHARIALAEVKVGFPEVKLGLIPGAGGTQYATRVAGPIRALDLIVSGKLIEASEAREIGLLDAVVEGDILAHARRMAAEIAEGRAAPKPVRTIGIPDYDRTAYEAAVSAVVAKARQSRAVSAAVEAVNAAIVLPFDEGVARERTLFETLRTGEQSRALRYQFFAEREAARVSGVEKYTAVAEIETVGIVGGGTMGRGIALAFLSAGYMVKIVEVDAKGTQAAEQGVLSSLKRDLDRGRLTQERFERQVSAFSVLHGDASLLSDAGLVVEAAFEDVAIKKDIFTTLDEVLPAGAIMATNTSSLDIDEIASATQHPEFVLGLHFFSPANIMKLLEIVRGAKTSSETLATALAVAKRLRKTAVVVGNCDGFVGNRMLAQRHIAAERLLIEGALPEQVDRAWTEFGFPMGVFAMTDLAGVDVNWRVRKARGTALRIHDAVYELGRYGQKTGVGFYRYEPGQRMPVVDPEIEILIVSASKEAGIERRDIPESEIVERLLYPMINEGARLLEEGIAQRASDIDVVWVNGYGWPVWKGGPMYHADTIGLSRIADALLRMSRQSADPRLEPAPLLKRLAKAGERFTE